MEVNIDERMRFEKRKYCGKYTPHRLVIAIFFVF